jgi:dihydroorotate dehydrogenase (fumarate)
MSRDTDPPALPWRHDGSIDLNTSYLGLELRNPVVASASPLTGRIDDLVRIEHSGAGAVVLPSLFEEQIEQEAMLMDVMGGFDLGPEAIGGHVPQVEHLTGGPDQYLSLVEEAVEALHIPVIASLNGTTPGGWTSFAELVQDAGAHALELNIYDVAADPDVTCAELEDQYVRLVSSVRSIVEIPLAVKLGPHFSSMANLARKFEDAGADGLVLFNRFYQPDIDLDDLTVAPNLTLSNSGELRFLLRWIAILRGQLSCSLAATTGVHTSEDVVKALLAGADVAMMTSALLANGPTHVQTVLDETTIWFESRGYESLNQARGSLSQRAVPNPSAFERSNYAKTLASYHPSR